MASISKEITISGFPDLVWKVAGDFSSIAEWHPLIDSSKMVEGEEEPRRILTLSDGGTVDERLLEIDEDKHYYTYTILESAIPFSNYRATISVQPEDDGSKVVWSATYDPESGEEATCEEIISQVFSSGLTALRKNIES